VGVEAEEEGVEEGGAACEEGHLCACVYGGRDLRRLCSALVRGEGVITEDERVDTKTHLVRQQPGRHRRHLCHCGVGHGQRPAAQAGGHGLDGLYACEGMEMMDERRGPAGCVYRPPRDMQRSTPPRRPAIRPTNPTKSKTIRAPSIERTSCRASSILGSISSSADMAS
jgi:hypothetical protein